MIVTLTPKQAEYLAALLTQLQRAQSVYAEAVALQALPAATATWTAADGRD